MDTTLVIVMLVLFIAAMVVILRFGSRLAPRPGWDGLPEKDTRTVVRVALDVPPGAEPDSPFVARLVQDAGARVLREHAQADVVEVVDRAGVVLGRIERTPQAAGGPVVDQASLGAREAARHAKGAHVPEPVEHQSSHVTLHIEQLDFSRPSDKAIADRFQLPDAVRSQISDPGDPVELVRALVAAGGHTPAVDGQVVRVGDLALVVVRPSDGHAITREDLNRAFHAFEASGAPRGVELCLGFVDPAEARRRETAAPSLQHEGPEAIQRMADALALGADPVAFATGPVITV